MKKYYIEKNKRCFSDVPGAVFVSWDTHAYFIEVRLAIAGLKKTEGCVDYYSCKPDDNHLTLNRKECNYIYYNHPKKEEAWLVLPDGTGYEWIRIDDQIEFS